MQRPRKSSVAELMTINLPLSVCSAQHSNGLDTDQLLLLFAHCTAARLNAAALLPMLKDRTTQAYSRHTSRVLQIPAKAIADFLTVTSTSLYRS